MKTKEKENHFWRIFVKQGNKAQDMVVVAVVQKWLKEVHCIPL